MTIESILSLTTVNLIALISTSTNLESVESSLLSVALNLTSIKDQSLIWSEREADGL